MNLKTDPFEAILTNRSALSAERKKLLDRVAEIDREIVNQDVAIEVLRKVMPGSLPAIPDGFKPVNLISTGPPPLVKDMILAVLRRVYPDGLNAAQIKEKAMQMFGQDINPNTLTVSLSRHKVDGLVELRGRIWRAVEQKNEAANPPEQ